MTTIASGGVYSVVDRGNGKKSKQNPTCCFNEAEINQLLGPNNPMRLRSVKTEKHSSGKRHNVEAASEILSPFMCSNSSCTTPPSAQSAESAIEYAYEDNEEGRAIGNVEPSETVTFPTESLDELPESPFWKDSTDPDRLIASPQIILSPGSSSIMSPLGLSRLGVKRARKGKKVETESPVEKQKTVTPSRASFSGVGGTPTTATPEVHTSFLDSVLLTPDTGLRTEADVSRSQSRSSSCQDSTEQPTDELSENNLFANSNFVFKPASDVDNLVGLEELEQFAKEFKSTRTKKGFTQWDIGNLLGKMYGCDVSQTTISRFEALNLSFTNMCKFKQILEKWLVDIEQLDRDGSIREVIKNGSASADIPLVDPSLLKPRRKRTSMHNAVKNALEEYFVSTPMPEGDKLTFIANALSLDREVVRVWFCNRRQRERRRKKVGGESNSAESTVPAFVLSSSVPSQTDNSYHSQDSNLNSSLTSEES